MHFAAAVKELCKSAKIWQS